VNLMVDERKEMESVQGKVRYKYGQVGTARPGFPI
jgi:hypothetical protein